MFKYRVTALVGALYADYLSEEGPRDTKSISEVSINALVSEEEVSLGNLSFQLLLVGYVEMGRQ